MFPGIMTIAHCFGSDMSLFACTYDDVISVASTVSSLLTNTLESVEKDRISLHLPTPVLHEVQPNLPAFLDWTTVTSDDDHGWMYKTQRRPEIHVRHGQRPPTCNMACGWFLTMDSFYLMNELPMPWAWRTVVAHLPLRDRGRDRKRHAPVPLAPSNERRDRTPRICPRDQSHPHSEPDSCLAPTTTTVVSNLLVACILQSPCESLGSARRCIL